PPNSVERLARTAGYPVGTGLNLPTRRTAPLRSGVTGHAVFAPTATTQLVSSRHPPRNRRDRSHRSARGLPARSTQEAHQSHQYAHPGLGGTTPPNSKAFSPREAEVARREFKRRARFWGLGLRSTPP